MGTCHIKRLFFSATKGVDLSLEMWPSRKAFKSILQNTRLHLMLDLLYHKRNHLFTTLVDSSIFLESI